MENEFENNDSTNVDNQDENLDAHEGDEATEDVAKLKENNRHLFERAKKAETDLKKAKDDLKKASEANKGETKPAESQPNNYDNERLARIELRVSGITNADDQKLILDEANRLKLPISEVADMPHMKTKLAERQEERDAQDGMPRGSRRTGGLTKHDVEYYLANPDKRPESQELAEKVLDAKMKKQSSDNMFSEEMYN